MAGGSGPLHLAKHAQYHLCCRANEAARASEPLSSTRRVRAAGREHVMGT